MSERLNVILLYGGKSGEHEISLRSAASVLANLDSNKYAVTPIGMDKEGRCYAHEYADLLHYGASLPVQTPKAKQLPSLLVDGRWAMAADVIFPVVHGPMYEDGCLQGLIELAGIALVGSNVLPSALSMDKDMARRVVCNDTIRCARYKTLSWHTSQSERQQFAQQVMAEFHWPLFVKPCSLGSSVGIHKVKNLSELSAGIEDALRYDEMILVEEGVKGREIELAVLENAQPSAFPEVSVAGEICVNHPDGFYSYAAKYLQSEQTDLVVPATLNDQLTTQVQQIAGEIFQRLKCRGMARVDFFVNDETGVIYFNELNTLPGFTSISMYPKLWQASGVAYSDLLDRLITLAMAHQRCKNQLVTSYQ